MTINNFNFAGKKAIVRVDFNVPLNENGVITDDMYPRCASNLEEDFSRWWCSHHHEPHG